MEEAVMRPSEREEYKKLLIGWNDRVAAVWDRYFVPAIAPIRKRLLDLAEVEPGDRILDVGTGTGGAALAAARRVGKEGGVVGIDTSTNMLKIARRNAARLGLTTVRFTLMDSASLEFEDGSFDAVVSSFGQPEAPWDFPAALLEWRRVLVPGGRFAHCGEGDSGDDPSVEDFERVFEKYRVRHPSAGLASTRRLRALAAKAAARVPGRGAFLLEAAGFTDVRRLTEPVEVAIPVQARLEPSMLWGKLDEYLAMSPQIRGKFRREVINALRPFTTMKGSVNFLLARRAKS